MNARTEVHKQSRWEIVGLVLTAILIAGTSISLFTWALLTPTTDPRNEPSDGASPIVMMEA